MTTRRVNTFALNVTPAVVILALVNVLTHGCVYASWESYINCTSSYKLHFIRTLHQRKQTYAIRGTMFCPATRAFATYHATRDVCARAIDITPTVVHHAFVAYTVVFHAIQRIVRA